MEEKDIEVILQRARECHSDVTNRPSIDFEVLKLQITIAAVMNLLGIDMGEKAQYRGPCPLHGSTSGTSRSFSANREKNCYHCFKCDCHGNALDLWSQATKQSPYDAAIDLCQRLGLAVSLRKCEDAGTGKRNP